MRIIHMDFIRDELISQIRAKRLFPVIGSGFTAGCRANKGVVPTGTEMLDYMEDYLNNNGYSHEIEGLRNKSYSKIAYYYNKLAPQKEKSNYLYDSFMNVSIIDERLKFLSIDWEYIYTINIDDGIEKNSGYKMVLAPNRSINEKALVDNKCLFKIHGDVEEIYKYAEGDKYAILDFEQYINSLTSNKFILGKLTHDYMFNNLIFIGCSLDDEIDMLAIFKSIEKSKDYQTNRYIICEKEPNALKKLDLEAYGINTIVIVDSYKWFYEEFEKIYLFAKSIPDNQLDAYSNIKSSNQKETFEDNIGYLLKGKKIFNTSNNEFCIPYFFINRTISKNIIEDMEQKRLQFIFGGRISGKTYCLAGITEKIKNRDTYYFDSRLSIHESNLLKLIEKVNSVIIIDTNVLSKNSIKLLIEYDLYKLNEQNTNVIICINKSDKDVLSLIGSKMSLNANNYIGLYEINNKFDKSELDAINGFLPRLSIPIFEMRKSILDNIFEIERTILRERNIPKTRLVINTYFEMALCILLATFEKVDSQTIVGYHLVQESFLITKKIPKIVEEHYTLPFEVYISNSSYYKLVCNAEYWLLELLGEYASDSNKHEIIQEAYYHLVQCLLDNNHRNYKVVEDLIKFDVINAIFAKKEKGSRVLIKKVYTKLNNLLADSYQYNHQKAKCYLWEIDYSRNREVEIKESLRFALIAKKMVEEHLLKSDNEMLLISLAHIKYTISIIYMKLNKYHDYQNVEYIKNNIEFFCEAVNTPYNDEAFNDIINKKDSNNKDLMNFINYCLTQDLSLLKLKDIEKKSLESSINKLLKRK